MFDPSDYSSVGIRICEKAGVIESCEYHEDHFWLLGGDEREAYRVGMGMLKQGDDLVQGLSTEELKTVIARAIREAGVDGCNYPDCPNG